MPPLNGVTKITINNLSCIYFTFCFIYRILLTTALCTFLYLTYYKYCNIMQTCGRNILARATCPSCHTKMSVVNSMEITYILSGLSMSCLRPPLQPVRASRHSHAHAHRRAALPLRSLPEGV